MEYKCKNKGAVANASKNGKTPLYYNIATDEVFTRPGDGRWWEC